MADYVAVQSRMEPAGAEALAQLVKQAFRHNLGPTGHNLTHSHRPGEARRIEATRQAVARELARASFDLR